MVDGGVHGALALFRRHFGMDDHLCGRVRLLGGLIGDEAVRAVEVSLQVRRRRKHVADLAAGIEQLLGGIEQFEAAVSREVSGGEVVARGTGLVRIEV